MTDKNEFKKSIAYNVLQLTTKARNDFLYAHQIIRETYVMRDDYNLPPNTEPNLWHADKKCAEDVIPAMNEVVADIASMYVRCCEQANGDK